MYSVMEEVIDITDLMENAFYGDQDMALCLLPQPGNIMATDSLSGLNALFYAVLGCHADIVEQLLHHEKAHELVASNAPGNISRMYLA
jgi:ankyrin repeat protein